jgi:predicted HTH domain antitoxin
MSERLSIVIPSDLNKEIDKLKEILKMDKSSTIRHLLLKSIREIKIETALNDYKKGKVSFGRASEIAGINLWEFIDLCHTHKIGLDLTEEEVEIGINRILKLDLSKYKQKMKKTLESNKK